MKLPVQVRPLIVPVTFVNYWYSYGRCLACKQEINHEMHLYNHYRKYHWLYKSITHYYVWYGFLQKWVEVNYYWYNDNKQKHKRPTAVARECY